MFFIVFIYKKNESIISIIKLATRGLNPTETITFLISDSFKLYLSEISEMIFFEIVLLFKFLSVLAEVIVGAIALVETVKVKAKMDNLETNFLFPPKFHYIYK